MTQKAQHVCCSVADGNDANADDADTNGADDERMMSLMLVMLMMQLQSSTCVGIKTFCAELLLSGSLPRS